VGITVPSQAAILVYHATLNGPNEGTASPGTGLGQVSYNNTLDMTLASSWNPAYITANGGTTASAALALAAGMAVDNDSFS
jgi:hypothetical protein